VPDIAVVGLLRVDDEDVARGEMVCLGVDPDHRRARREVLYLPVVPGVEVIDETRTRIGAVEGVDEGHRPAVWVGTRDAGDATHRDRCCPCASGSWLHSGFAIESEKAHRPCAIWASERCAVGSLSPHE